MPLDDDETPAQMMARVSREVRASAQPVLGSGYSANIGGRMGPLSGTVFSSSADRVAGQPTAAGVAAGLGPLSAHFVQPTFKGAPPAYGVGLGGKPFDADTYFGVQGTKTPGGMQYGVNVARDGAFLSGSYNPTNRDVSIMGGYERRFQEGGPVLTPRRLGALIQPPEEQGAISPSAEGVGEGLQAVASGTIPALQTAGQYIAETPFTQVLRDVGTLGGKMYEAAKENPAEFIGGMLPVIGNMYSAKDVSELKDKIREARAAGDEERALTLEKFVPLAAAGAIMPVGAGAATRSAVKSAEKAALREGIDAASDAARLADNAPKMEQAAAISKEFEPVHNLDTIGAQKKADQPITGGNEDFQFTALEREVREKVSARITKAEREEISQLASGTKIDPEKDATVDPKKALQAYKDIKEKYPESDGWAPFEVVGFERDSKNNVKFDEDGLPVLKIKQEAYGFHQKTGDEKRIAEGSWDQTHVEDIADKLVKEVKEVADRADRGDKNADVIMGARTWYAKMRDRLRQEYGGFADVMADVLGTTSAQTNVRQNWENTIEVLSQFSRGAYDRALTKLNDWLEAGGEMGSAGVKDGKGYLNRHLQDIEAAMPNARLQAEAEGLTGKAMQARAKELAFQKAQAGDFPLITKADGKTLFNANSPQTMMALLDEFRKRKVGDAPKTPNFTGNLIGYSDKATIDLWAARLLRRLSGRSRLIPDAESGVGGTYLANPLESGIQVGGEFGFGQEVFQKAAEKLRQDPRFKDLGDDDLQAIAWFLEKEQWAKKGATTKAGEGGSLELEANFAGVSDREALKEQRRLAETDPTFAERARLRKELDDPQIAKDREAAREALDESGWILDYKTPAQRRNAVMEREGLDKGAATERAETLYSEARAAQDVEKKIATRENRLATLEERAQSIPAAARANLNEMQAIARSFTGGWSPDRPDAPAMPEMFVEANKAIIGPLESNSNVMMMKATRSQGRYIDPEGNIWDEPALDLEFVTRQDFDPNPTLRNMVEQAKKRNQDSTFLSERVEAGTVEGANPGIEVYFTKKLGQDEVERLTETINQLGVDAGFTFVTDFRAKNRAAGGENVGEYVGIRLQFIPEFSPKGVEGVAEAHLKMLDAIDNISAFDGVSSARYIEYDTQVVFKDQYDGYLTGNVPTGRQASWARQSSSESAEATDRSAGVLERAVGGAVVHRRGSGSADAGNKEKQTSLKSQIHFEQSVSITAKDIAQLAEDGDLDQRKIAYLIRMASTGTIEPDKAFEFAGEIMSVNVPALMMRFSRYPRAMRILARVDDALGGEGFRTLGLIANRRLGASPTQQFAKGGTVKKRMPYQGDKEAFEAFSKFAVQNYGLEIGGNMIRRSGGNAAKLMFALNQYEKNEKAQVGGPAAAQAYREYVQQLNQIARQFNIDPRAAFNQTSDAMKTKQELATIVKSDHKMNPAFKEALERMDRLVGSR